MIPVADWLHFHLEGQPAKLLDSTDRDQRIRAVAMPKMKTHKGVKKRFRATANKKIKHRRAGTSHLNSRMTQKRKRNLRGTGVLLKPDTNRLLEALAGNSY
jgi:large subunit ribosomal protein L35